MSETLLSNGAIALLLPIFMIIGALLARFAASIVLDRSSASIAAFAFILGVNVSNPARYGTDAPDFMPGIMVGSILGLIAIWFLLFKRLKNNG